VETTEIIEKFSRKYAMSPESFIKFSSGLALREKKKNLQIERFEILARYGSSSTSELETKIGEGLVPEHPAWEDLIEIQNIEQEIKELDDDIRTLQAA
jgi:hypothetical protein